MQSWLPAQGSGIAVLRALPIVVVVVFQTQFALGVERSLTVLPTGPSSTLDSHVAPQDFDMRKTVIDFVDSGILAGRKAPRFYAPGSKASASQSARASAPKLQGPALALPTPKNSQQTDAKPKLAGPITQPEGNTNQATEGKAAKPSPFSKWVKPKANTDQEATGVSVPKLARRSAKTAPKKDVFETAKPLPQPAKKRSTAAVSDITPPGLVEEESLPKITLKKTPEPQPSDYPAPRAGQSSKPSSVKKLPPLTRSQLNLRKKIRSVLTHYYNRPLNTRDRSPWELMHAMLAFEADSKVLQGGPNGEPITAVGWLCYNQACKRRTLMYVDDEEKLQVRVGPALQGHRGQLLSMLAQSRINKNYPMLVEGHELKVNDLIEMEKRTCYPRTELTFKLIGLMHYLDSNATWLNDQGMEWSIPRLISEEIRQPVRGAACGGTHRLSGLTLAYKTREARGEPVDGEYLRAKKFVKRYQQYAYRQQNRDGSFSTEWFRGPGNEQDIDRKLKTTGHILEWLLYAASEKELKHSKTTRAANYLATIMSRNRNKNWESGPLGHAIHALLVYDRLVFSPYDPPEQSNLALKSLPSRRTQQRKR